VASTAIPGIFPPVLVEGQLLVDGALVDRVPISTALKLGAKTIVIFDSSFPCEVTKVPAGYLPRLIHMLTILMQQQPLKTLSDCSEKDVAILYLPSPCPQVVLPHDFSQAAKLIDDG
jgi:NTE family protein